YIASKAEVTPDMPWEIYYAVDQLVYVKKTYAASRAGSTRYDVPWLSLILRDHAKAAADVLQEAMTQGVFPESWFRVGDRVLFTRDEALSRYRAAIEWFNTYQHLIISQGPFYLYAIDTLNQYIELRAFRDPTYPFRPGDFYYGVATPVSIRSIDIPVVNVGQKATVSISIDVPTGAGNVIYKWGIVDLLTGEYLFISEELTAPSPSFNLDIPADITSKLAPNKAYKLWLLAYAENVPIVTEATQVFVPGTAVVTPPPTPQPTPEPSTGGGEVLVAAILGLVVVLIALALALRRRGKAGETKVR
ncbi:MAG: LPXTG cell wall anchor domain-containing protein, partial [Pyrobaculum sp.]